MSADQPQRGARPAAAGIVPARRGFAFGLFAVAAAPRLAWGAVGSDGNLQRAAQPLMGTQVSITVVHSDAAQRELALRAAWDEMQRLSEMMSRYRSASRVAALAASAGNRPVAVAPQMRQALAQARDMSIASDGAFDITVGAYAGWRFDGGPQSVPPAGELQAERRLVDFRDVLVDEARGTAYLRRPGMRIDLGGIAKLPILAAGLQALREHGVGDAMIDGGGDVLCSGQLHGRAWRVGLRDPRAPQRLLGVVEIGEGIVASSGDYERFFEQDGRRYHHILDPRTGMPSRGPHGVALVARDVAAVNGLGAAIMVGGAAAGRHWLGKRREVDALIVGDGAAMNAPWLSPGMARRLRTV